MWKPINCYFWPYRINDMGEVQRLNHMDEWVPVNSFVKRDRDHKGGSGRLCIRVKLANGKWANVFVKNLMIDAFFGGKKPGVVYTHRNGAVSDCSVYNLVPSTEKEVAKRVGGASRRSVEKVDKQGRVVALYASVTEAAEKNFMHRKSIWMRCTNQVRNPYLLDGYTYRYEEKRGGRPKKGEKNVKKTNHTSDPTSAGPED